MICSWLMLVAGVHGIPHPLFPLHVYFHIPQARSSKAGLASSSSCWLGHTNLGGWPPGCDAGSFFQELHVVKKKSAHDHNTTKGEGGWNASSRYHPSQSHPNMFLWLRLITHKKLTTHAASTLEVNVNMPDLGKRRPMTGETQALLCSKTELVA